MGIRGLLAAALFGCADSDLAAQGVSTNNDTLAPARKGALACFRPNLEKKQCNTISRFIFEHDDLVHVYSDVTMSETVVMSAKVAATIKAGAVCSSGEAEDIEAAAFTISGRPASEEETREIRSQLTANLRARPRKELCLAFVSNSNRYAAEATFDGVRYPKFDEAMIWVQPDAGYVAYPLDR